MKVSRLKEILSQFDTLFEYLDGKVESIVNTSVDYQDSELLEDFEDLFEVHDILEDIKVQHEKKLQQQRVGVSSLSIMTFN